MTECAFCDLVAAEKYDSIERDVVSFTPLSPVTPSHRLFVPVEHVADATAKPWVTARVMEVASAYARNARALSCNLITSVGSAATQSVFHLHVHYVPRHEGDGFALPWTGQHD